jgi:uncharacterized RDD family membrane protein YckC
MEIEDRYVTSTPEGVSLSVVLAGLGSRMGAYTIDFLVQLTIIAIAAIAVFVVARTTTSAYVALGIYGLITFVTMFGYFVLFETFDSGRSLGKRALGLRVRRLDGSGVTFRASLVRNLMRILYAFGIFYLVDAALILWTQRNQRLGDLLAGTIVVRERFGDRQLVSNSWQDPSVWGSGPTPYGPPGYGPPGYGPPGYGAPAPFWLPPEVAAWDVTAVTASDLTVIVAFLSRRHQYVPQARESLAQELASRIAPKVGGVLGPLHPEAFLEAVAALKSARS